MPTSVVKTRLEITQLAKLRREALNRKIDLDSAASLFFAQGVKHLFSRRKVLNTSSLVTRHSSLRKAATRHSSLRHADTNH